jgi:hypothetical protein
MSFEEFDDCFIWRCDGCGLHADFPPRSFFGALAELKARGRRISRDGEGWAHSCGKCKAKADAGLLDRLPTRGLRRV